MDTAAVTPRLYLDAVITPHRSLSRGGLFLLIGLLVTVNLAMGLYFVSIGAPPIPVFLGLDVAGLVLAFWISNRQGRRVERVRVSADALEVVRQDGRGEHLLWRAPTAFVRAAFEVPEEHQCRVRLSASGRSVDVGGELSPKERRSLYIAIDDAIRAARRERHP